MKSARRLVLPIIKEHRQMKRDMRTLRMSIKKEDKKHSRKMKELERVLEEPVPKGYVPYVDDSESNNDVSKLVKSFRKVGV